MVRMKIFTGVLSNNKLQNQKYNLVSSLKLNRQIVMDFIENKGLFTQSVFDTFCQNNNGLYISEDCLEQSAERLIQLISYWGKESGNILVPLSIKDKVPKLARSTSRFFFISQLRKRHRTRAH